MVRAAARLAEIMRFPVKSMAGERCASADVDWQGIEGDRQYGFIRRGNTTRFPWFTARDHAELVRFRARYDDPDRPRTSPVRVTAPDGRDWVLDDLDLQATLATASGQSVDLLQLGIGAYDLMPISIVTTASLARLATWHGGVLDRRRFRANLVIDCDTHETEWKGRRVRFGDGEGGAELLLAYPAPRCAMVTIDPDSAQRDPAVLRTIASKLGNAFTMYASVARPGVIREGDEVNLSDG